jgi:hypothetical protein
MMTNGVPSVQAQSEFHCRASSSTLALIPWNPSRQIRVHGGRMGRGFLRQDFRCVGSIYLDKFFQNPTHCGIVKVAPVVELFPHLQSHIFGSDFSWSVKSARPQISFSVMLAAHGVVSGALVHANHRTTKNKHTHTSMSVAISFSLGLRYHDIPAGETKLERWALRAFRSQSVMRFFITSRTETCHSPVRPRRPSRTAVEEKLMEEFTADQKTKIAEFRRTSDEQFENRRRTFRASVLDETKDLSPAEFKGYLDRIRVARTAAQAKL